MTVDHELSAPKPILLSALLDVVTNKEERRRDICSRALEKPELRAKEIRDGCPYCTLRQEIITKFFPDIDEKSRPKTDNYSRHGITNGYPNWDRARLYVTDGKYAVARVN
jgi:hypothetical protein